MSGFWSGVLWKGCRIGLSALKEDTRQGVEIWEMGILGIGIGQCSLRFQPPWSRRRRVKRCGQSSAVPEIFNSKSNDFIMITA